MGEVVVFLCAEVSMLYSVPYGSFRPGMYNCGKLGPCASLGGCPKRIYQTKMKTHTVVHPYIEESANTNYTPDILSIAVFVTHLLEP